MARDRDRATDDAVRLPWSRSDRPVPRRVLRPLQSFLAQEAASGLLLFTAAVLALIWSNSPWSSSYETVWHTTLSLRVGRWTVSEDLRHWVNDGLMALFFLVVGLEIKREILTGELRERRAMALPVAAAVGGMIVPAAIFLVVNAGNGSSRGWGIPMATDIAFALGVLTLAARAAPGPLKPFLLALAIVDDIGAIVVIAIFYSEGVALGALAVAAALCVAIWILTRLSIRSIPLYLLLGVLVWFATFRSGVHPTIAGVALGFLTPAAPFQRPRAVSLEAHRTADETVDDPEPPDADAHHWLRLASLARQAVSPLARLEELLHPWTSWFVVPLFALANAGVAVSFSGLSDAMTEPLSLGIIVGLVVGKPLGVAAAAYLAVRSGVARLPRRVSWRHVVAVGAVAGIGFTVSLFISDLAYAGSPELSEAKLGVLIASVVAGVAGSLLLRMTRDRRADDTLAPRGGRDDGRR